MTRIEAERKFLLARNRIQFVNICSRFIHIGAYRAVNLAITAGKHVFKAAGDVVFFKRRDEAGVSFNIQLPFVVVLQPLVVTVEGGMNDHISAIDIVADGAALFHNHEKILVHFGVSVGIERKRRVRLIEGDAVFFGGFLIGTRFLQNFFNGRVQNALADVVFDVVAAQAVVNIEIHRIKARFLDDAKTLVNAEMIQNTAGLNRNLHTAYTSKLCIIIF